MLPAIRNDAISVSSRMLICATDEPNIAGSISLKIRRTPSCARSQRGRGRRSRPPQERQLERELHHAGREHAGREPEPGRSSAGSTHPANTIMTTFRSTGVKAATANRR